MEATYPVKPHTARDRAVLPWNVRVNRTGDQDLEAVPFDGGPSGFLVPDISGTPSSMRAGYPWTLWGWGREPPKLPDKQKAPPGETGLGRLEVLTTNHSAASM